jgi:lysophospholipase L1-like esterase
MKHLAFALLLPFASLTAGWAAPTTPVRPEKLTLFTADNPNIQYTGRIDFADPKKPRFWAPGVYITATFEGSTCDIVVADEVLGGKTHNYLEVVVDGKPTRLKLTSKENTLRVAENLPGKRHTLVVCKDTEAGIGYLQFVGVKCARLLPPPPKPTRKIEFIGNSITCGTGSDLSAVPCGKGEWHDQHNAYLAYGPLVARALNAQWHLSAVSGIGLVRSCCDMGIVMPEVFDKINQRANSLAWDFARYQPDVVTITLGQNDGVQDSAKFCGAYVAFIKVVRSKYPKAHLVCLTSPMADAKLMAVLQRYLTGVVSAVQASGDQAVSKFFYSRRYNSGCDNHPDLAEHQLIANELGAYLQSTLGW